MVAQPPPLPELLKITAAGDAAVLQAVVQYVSNAARPGNTKLAYYGKVDEFQAYCDHRYADNSVASSRYTVTFDRIYQFIFYNAFRETRKGRKKKKDRNGVVLEEEEDRFGFKGAEFEETIEKYLTGPGQSRGVAVLDDEHCVEPQKPVGLSSMVNYKAAINHVWQVQVANGCNNAAWDHIWTLPLRNLFDLVKKRRNRVRSKNYEEKMNHEFAPYTVIKDVPRIEEALFEKGCHGGGMRSAFSWLRNRFCFLYTLNGILRTESLNKAELSDLCGICMQKPRDPHLLLLSIMQIATGKFYRFYEVLTHSFVLTNLLCEISILLIVAFGHSFFI